MAQPKIIAYLKPHCGWSKGVRAVFAKYGLEFEDRDIWNDPTQRAEMVRKSGQELSPVVELDGEILADVSGDEVEAYLVQQGLVQESTARAEVPTGQGCSDEDHLAQAAQSGVIHFKK